MNEVNGKVLNFQKCLMRSKKIDESSFECNQFKLSDELNVSKTDLRSDASWLCTEVEI